MIDRDLAYLYDIIEQIGNIEDFYSSGLLDKKTAYAIERSLSIIGEASNRLSDGIKASKPKIEWHKIKGMRNIIVHDYGNIDEGLIKEVIKYNLPELKDAIEDLIKKLEGNKNAN